MEYRGYKVFVGIFPDMSSVVASYMGKYIIRRGLKEVFAGSTTDGLTSVGDAEHESYRAAREWIDQQP